MALKISIFEDNKDLVDSLKEFLEEDHFTVITCFNLNSPEWKDSDVVIGDFRNAIVGFDSLKKECTSMNIPLLAISGAETNHDPQLLKPFTVEELKNAIFKTMIRAKEQGLTRKPLPSESLLDKLSFWKKG